MEPVVVLGLAASLHIHASGALTYCSPGEEPGWDDDEPVFATLA
jgi:hypothetical protein